MSGGVPTVAVIGGGITGLAAAHALSGADRRLDITVLEREERLGGKILTEHVDGFTIEGGPDAFLSVKPRGVGLAGELGLADRFVSPRAENASAFVLNGGRLDPLPEGLTGLVPSRLGPMFRSPLLSPAGKARLAAELAVPVRREEGDESVAAFIARRFGTEAYRRMIEPLMAGIYAGDGHALSLAATFPQLRETELRHGGILRGAIATRRAQRRRGAGPAPKRGFLSFRDGMGELVERLKAELRSRGVRIETGRDVRAIRRDTVTGRFDVDIAGATPSIHTFDAVILTAPAWAAADLARDVAPDAARALDGIPHVSTALVACAFDAAAIPPDRLRGYGYVVPRAADRPVMAMTWVSSKWAGRAPDGRVLVRAFIGRAGQEHYLTGDDASLVGIAREELAGVLGIAAAPVLSRVYRRERGMPQYTLGHPDRLAAIEAACADVPGFEIAGNMFRGVGIPDCIASGEAAASRVMTALEGRAIEPIAAATA